MSESLCTLWGALILKFHAVVRKLIHIWTYMDSYSSNECVEKKKKTSVFFRESAGYFWFPLVSFVEQEANTNLFAAWKEHWTGLEYDQGLQNIIRVLAILQIFLRVTVMRDWLQNSLYTPLHHCYKNTNCPVSTVSEKQGSICGNTGSSYSCCYFFSLFVDWLVGCHVQEVL